VGILWKSDWPDEETSAEIQMRRGLLSLNGKERNQLQYLGLDVYYRKRLEQRRLNHLAQGRDKRRAVMNMVSNHQLPKMMRISQISEGTPASQKGFCSMTLASTATTESI
jgi:hypothetical protein